MSCCQLHLLLLLALPILRLVLRYGPALAAAVFAGPLPAPGVPTDVRLGAVQVHPVPGILVPESFAYSKPVGLFGVIVEEVEFLLGEAGGEVGPDRGTPGATIKCTAK